MENTKTMQENIVEMMSNEVENLQEELTNAKVAFAEINLEDGDYRCRDERKTTCKVLEGQIHMLQKMMSVVSSMTMDIKMMPSLAQI